MDATIYQILFGELGDLNCSLIDAFQDTFLENASLSLLSTDGKTLLLLLLFFFWCWIFSGIVCWMREAIRNIYSCICFTFILRFILQCNNRWDRNLLAAERHRENCRETLPWVHQRGEVQHNEWDIKPSLQNFCVVYLFFDVMSLCWIGLPNMKKKEKNAHKAARCAGFR